MGPARRVVLAVVVALSAQLPTAHAQETSAAEPSERIEGAPTRLEVQVIDITRLSAQRDVYVVTDTPFAQGYLLTRPKERPWGFTSTRPQQARVLLPAEGPASPTARAEVIPAAQGSLKYRVDLARSGDRVHGALQAAGESQNDAFTRSRGALNDLALRGSVGWLSNFDAGSANAQWRTRTLNWIMPGIEGDLLLGKRTGALLSASGMWSSRGEPESRPNAELRASASEWNLKADGDESVADRVADASLDGKLTWDRDADPISLVGSLRYVRSEAEGRSNSYGIGTVSIHDRFVSFSSGAVSYAVGLGLYGEPRSAPAAEESSRSTRVAVPFRVEWSSFISDAMSWSTSAGYAVNAAGTKPYEQQDWLRVNRDLPPSRTWHAATSLRTASKPLSWTVQAGLRRMHGLPIWVESADAAGAIGWIPIPATANLLGADGSAEIALTSRLSLGAFAATEMVLGDPTCEMDGEVHSPDHLPYRPQVTARAHARWSDGDRWTARVGTAWSGKQYTEREGDASIDPYAVADAELARRFGAAVEAFVSGEVSIGERQRLRSSRTDDAYSVTQNIAAAGLRVNF
ncbi:hypothetical protein FJZ36_08125 [Candidatus Poribacteria bacterium]|nr:hypothetical protein [Candidatus Poribacteria bacterium]